MAFGEAACALNSPCHLRGTSCVVSAHATDSMFHRRAKELATTLFTIIFPLVVSSSILVHKLEQLSAGSIAIFHKYCCYIKHGSVITNLNLWNPCGYVIDISKCHDAGVAVDTVFHKFPKRKSSSSRPLHTGKMSNPQPKQRTGNQCKWCERQPHAHHMWPSKEATCNHCHNMGHYENVCQKKRENLHEVESSPHNECLFTASPSTDDFFMGVLTLDVLYNPLTTEVSVGGTKVRFKVDTRSCTESPQHVQDMSTAGTELPVISICSCWTSQLYRSLDDLLPHGHYQCQKHGWTSVALSQTDT